MKLTFPLTWIFRNDACLRLNQLRKSFTFYISKKKLFQLVTENVKLTGFKDLDCVQTFPQMGEWWWKLYEIGEDMCVFEYSSHHH